MNILINHKGLESKAYHRGTRMKKRSSFLKLITTQCLPLLKCCNYTEFNTIRYTSEFKPNEFGEVELIMANSPQLEVCHESTHRKTENIILFSFLLKTSSYLQNSHNPILHINPNSTRI